MVSTAYTLRCVGLLLRIHVATSLSQIPAQEQIALDKLTRTSWRPFQSVLIVGSSVDRNAISSNYPGETFTFKQEKVQHNVVLDQARNVSIAVLCHPGVGLNGDLDAPFWNPSVTHEVAQAHSNGRPGRIPKNTLPDHGGKNGAHWKYEPTWKIIEDAPNFGHITFGPQPPDLVVVESSLWDLASWWQLTGHQATPERLEQWCNKDVPYLLKKVTDAFPKSQVVFRTAPQVAPENKGAERWTHANFETMHDCVMRRSAGTGKVFEHVGVIDYHGIMDKLISSTSDEKLRRDLWLEDGYHPSDVPGRLYLNEIFKLLGAEPMHAPKQARTKLPVEDENDL
mmetsp:Transcript_25252/g.65964  ORF Transcript_25252/g.65964 Transcript_25252/m.65964 type:complete len:339 (+) Transcript_25252:91-1107(+)